jgi:alpha-beta hydrolase superfamily lysophospholipase
MREEQCLIWCHGAQATPWGDKSRTLAATAQRFGLTMDAVDFQDLDDPDQRVERLVARLDETGKPAIVAGSSMGGYVAAAASARMNVLGLFLTAPALYLPGYALHVFSGLPATVRVVHGWADDVVPADNSIRFARQHRATLHLLNDGHRLSNSLDELGALFARFLETLQSRGNR